MHSAAFGIVEGLFRLSTAPPTGGVSAAVFGARDPSMLGGVVFLFHRVEAFLGGWLGGVAHDRLDSYDFVRLAAIGLGVIAAPINPPGAVRPVPYQATAVPAP